MPRPSCAALALALLAAGCGHAPVEVTCDQLEVPSGNTFTMQFTVVNRYHAAAGELGLSIHDTGLFGEPSGRDSHYVLHGRFEPGSNAVLAEDVPAPPHFRMLKFSKLDCTLDRVVFEDGARWH